MRIGTQAQDQTLKSLKVLQQIQEHNDSILESEDEARDNAEYRQALADLGIQLN